MLAERELGAPLEGSDIENELHERLLSKNES